jgi:hydrogenase maturation protease
MTQDETGRRERTGESPRPPILILGIGNILLRDEGIGVRVIEAMRQVKLPDNVELLDGGTASMMLLDSLSNREQVIVIDAVKGGNAPGTLYRFTPAEISGRREMITSLHEIGLLESLAMVECLDNAPQEVTIYGIEPKEMGLGLELSSEVAAAIPRVVELILGEFGRTAASGSRLSSHDDER